MKVDGIGKRIRGVRGRISIPKFAEMNMVHKSTMIRYEKEESFPDAQFVVDFCNRFHLNPNWLLTGEGAKRVLPTAIEFSPFMNELRQTIRTLRAANSASYFAYIRGETWSAFGFKKTLSPDLLKSFIDKGTYLPTNDELVDLCRLGGVDFNLVKHDFDFDEEEEDQLAQYAKTKDCLDVVILKEILSSIEKFSQNCESVLTVDKKSTLASMLYEEVANNEISIGDLPERVAKLYMLAA